ncbi:MAG TPA: diguanylate cyclase [bacterium]|nr:diguanylate cyclase [bacterium]
MPTHIGQDPAPYRPLWLRMRARTSEEWISLVRVVLLLALIPALWFGVIRVSQPAVNASIMLFGAYVIVLALGPRWLRALRRADLTIALDILVVTLVVIISGNLASPFLYLYYLTILQAAARLNLRQAIAAALAMAGMIVLLWTHAEVTALETAGFRLGAIIAGGFFLALFLSMLVQEYRATQDRVLWADTLDQRLKEATKQLEEQLQELRFYNELAGRLSGELRVEGVLEILLEVFLPTVGLSEGVAYILGEDEAPHFATARGFDRAEGDHDAGTLSFPALPAGAVGGEVLLHMSDGSEGAPARRMACVPLVRAGSLRAWLGGLGDVPESFPEHVLRRLRGIATQGVSALEAARLHEEVQRMLSVNPNRSLYPWNGLQKLVAEEIRRSTELMLVFSLAEIQLEDYGSTSWIEDQDRDLALRRVVKLLQASLRRVDVASHDGAGRFVLLLARLPKIQSVEVLKRLTQKLEEDSVAARLLEVPRITVTAGVVTFPEDGSTASALLDKLRELVAQGPSTPARVHMPNS